MVEEGKGLWPFVGLLRPYWKWMAAGSLFNLITLSATVGLLALSGWFLSAAAHAGLVASTAQSFNYFFPSIGVRLFAVSRTLSRYADRIVSHDATFRLLAGLRVWFYERIEPLAPGRLMRFRSGELLNRIVSDIDDLDNLYLRVLSPAVTAAAAVLLLTIFLAVYDGVSALIALGGMLMAGGVVPAVAGKAGGEAGRRLSRLTADLRVRIVEGVQGMAELLVFGRRRDYLDGVGRAGISLIAAQRKMSHLRGIAAAAVTAAAGITVLAVLYRGADLVNRGELHGAKLAMIALAVLAAFEAVMPLPSAFQYLGRTREAARRLLEIVDSKPTVCFPDHPLAPPRCFDIAFDQVTFRYRAQDPLVLAHADFRVAAGQRVVVLGHTGAGKSTLAHLLTRFWDPQAGVIRIGGADIRRFAEADLRRIVTVVSQHSHLFNASVRDNLLIARPEATEAQLWEALRAVQLAEFVESLPLGLDTWVGEEGRLISGGQARRLTVARAILHNAPIWVLDEPTEGLDPLVERRLMDMLLGATTEKTVLLITHRLIGLERMDRILVMENGQIVESGSHADLIGGRTRYSALRSCLRS